MDFRQLFTGATLRAIAGIVDMGETIAGYLANPDGGSSTEIASDLTDVRAWVRDGAQTLSKAQHYLGRVFFPLNMMWRLPYDGDAAFAMRGAEAHGPGAPLVAHGDGMSNGKAAVPDWLTDHARSGISIPEILRVESTGDAVEIRSNRKGTVAIITLAKDGGIQIDTTASTKDVTINSGGKVNINAAAGSDIVLNGGTAQVSRVGDATTGHLHVETGNAGPYPIVGSTQTATDTMAQGAPHAKA